MSWQLKICSILIIFGIFWTLPGFLIAQEAQNSDLRLLETKIVVVSLPGLQKLQKAVLTVWQIISDKTVTFLAYAGEIVKKRRDIIQEDFKKEIDEMKQDFVKLFNFLRKKLSEKVSP